MAMIRLNKLITVGKGSPYTWFDLWDKKPLINYSTSQGMPAPITVDLIPLRQPTDQDFAGLREWADSQPFKNSNNSNGILWGDTPYYAASAGISIADSLANKGASNAVGNTFNTLGDVGMMLPGPYKAIGVGLKGLGFIANGFTNSVNKDYQRAKNNQIADYATTSSNASDYAGLQMDMDDALTNTVDLGKIGDWGSKGFLSSGSKRRNAFNLAQSANNAGIATRIADINQRGLEINKRNTFGQLGNLTAFGGYIGGALDIMQDDKHIDAINNRSLALAKQPNRFPNGGGMAGFLDMLKQDPIKGAVDYINTRRHMSNIFEEAQEADAREKAFQDMQRRVAAAETQNQGLQAMLDSQGLTIQNLMNLQMKNNYADNWRQRVNPEVTPKDSAIMARMRQSLIDRGVDNRAHQDAIIANMMVESSGNPNAKNPNSSARGLMQWLTGRQPKAWDWDSQVDHIVNTYNKFGGDNWLDKKAYDRFMNTTDSAEAARLLRQYWERPEKHTYNFTDKYINQMYSKKAFGGELGTNGTDFTNGLLEVNAGSTHEANPFQGVLLGVDAEGTPNLVEEGETIFNDYVFSNRLTVPAFMKKELGLGGKTDKNLTFADASKEIAEESVERPNDPISMNGLRAGLSKLALIQETERMRMQAEEDNTAMEMGLMAACGGKLNKFDYGGALKWIKQKYPQMQNKEAAARYLSRFIESDKDRHYYDVRDPKKVLYDKAWDFLNFSMGNAGKQSVIQKWLDLGASADEAFEFAFPSKTERNRAWVKELYNNVTKLSSAAPLSYENSDGITLPWNEVANQTLFNAPINYSAPSRAIYNTMSNSSKPVTNSGKKQWEASDGSVHNTKKEAEAVNNNIAKVTHTPKVEPKSIKQNSKVPSNSNNISTAARTVTPTANRGDIVNYKYDWYRNGTDGITDTPWGFTPNENGLIDRNTGYTDGYRNLVNTLTADDIRKWAAEHPNDTSLQSFIARGNNLDNLTTDQWRRGATDGKYGFMHHVASLIGQEQSTPTISGNVYHAVDGEGDYLPADQSSWRGVGNEVRREVLPNGDTVIYHAPGYGTQTQDNGYTFTDELLGINNGGNTSEVNEDIPLYPTWMRYAPAVGAGIMTLTDALGLTNKPDYTYANKIEAAANRLGYAPNIGYNPVDGYVAYNPFDRNYVANRMLDNSAGLRRSILNSNASNGARNQMMLAQNAQDQQGLGQMYRQADESDLSQRLQTGDFNRRTKIINSQLGLEAAMANARFRQQAQSSRLSGLAQAAAMRDAIDQRVGAARSANLTNFLTSLGNIGRENMAFNMINSDRAWDYGIRRNGVTGFKNRRRG